MVIFQLERLQFAKGTIGDGFSLTVDSVACVQSSVDEDILLCQDADSSSLLNFYLVEQFCASEDLLSNYNILLLLQRLDLSTVVQQDCENICLTLGDMLCTWSLRSHYILFESFVRPASNCRAKLCNKFVATSEQDLVPKKFKFSVLIESEMLVNFLFDYSLDSSKLEQVLKTGWLTISFYIDW